MTNLIQPLPIYDRLNEQARFKENCNAMYDFICPTNRLIPFQISIPNDLEAITSFKIYGMTAGVFNVNTTLNADVIKIVEEDGKKWVLFYGDGLLIPGFPAPAPLPITCGYWYFEITVDARVYYSEVFKVVNNGIYEQDPDLMIEAWHPATMSGYSFADDFRFRAFFDSFITNNIPETTDEFLKDGYERNILQRRVIEFLYNIELDPTPNNITIGLIAMTAMKNFVITEASGNEYVTKNVTVKQEPLDGGFLDSLQFTFTTFDQDIVRTNC